MNVRKHQHLRYKALGLALLLVAAACQADGGGEAGDEEVTFVMVAPSGLETLDPSTASSDLSRWTAYERSGMLVAYDTADLRGGGCDELASVDRLRGELAESWETTDGGSTITMVLREDALNAEGRAVTTEDVKWSFDRSLALSPTAAFLLQAVGGYAKNPLEIIDDRTFKLRFATEPNSLSLAVLTIFSFLIHDSEEAKTHATEDDEWASEWLSKNYRGFGPWDVSEEDFRSENSVTFRPNPEYWGPRGNIDRFIIRVVPESSARLQLLQAGEADYAASLSYDEYAEVSERPSGTQLLRCAGSDRDLLALNLKDERFRDSRVREAISLAINRSDIIEGPYQDLALPGTGAYHSLLELDAGEDVFEYDPERARELLTSAGHPNGFSATMTLGPAQPGPEAEQAGVLVRSQLQEIGIDLELEVIASGADLNERYDSGNYEVMLWREAPVVADPAYSLKIWSITDAVANTRQYSNPRLDRLAEAIAATDPGEARDQFLAEAAEVIAEDVPLVYLADTHHMYAMADNISGFQHPPTQGIVYVVNLTKE